MIDARLPQVFTATIISQGEHDRIIICRILTIGNVVSISHTRASTSTHQVFDQLHVECSTLERDFRYSIPREMRPMEISSGDAVSYQEKILMRVEF